MRTGAKPKSIDEYLALVSDEQRAALERLRGLIHAAIPGAEEYIGYGMPGFKKDGKGIVWIAAAAEHCALYPGGIVDEFADELARYETSKGTIRFQPDRPLPAALVKKLVKASLARRVPALSSRAKRGISR